METKPVQADVFCVAERRIAATTLRGDFTQEAARQIVAEMLRVAAERCTDLLLVDLREAKWQMDTVDIYELPAIFENAGVTRSYRQAVLVANRDGPCRFLQTVFLNRGYALRIFTEREQAICWLEGASP